MTFVNFQLLKSGLDVQPLLGAIEKYNYLWNEVKLRQEFKDSPHKNTKAIYIRWCKDLDLISAFNDLEGVDYPARELLAEVNPLIDEVMTESKASKLGRVMITKLNANSSIAAHPDEGVVAESYERFHIPLFSDSGNKFFAGNPKGKFEEVEMKPGELWVFNNKEVHWFNNQSNKERLHLIVDAVAPQFRRDLH